MDENKRDNCDVCGAGPAGRCGSCGMYRNYFGHKVLRWVLGIIIISWIFSIGVKFGELKVMIEQNSPYGHNFMMRVSPPILYSGQAIEGNAGNMMYSQTVPAGTVKVVNQ